MEENLTLSMVKTVKIKPPPKDQKQELRSVENMDMVIAHRDVGQARTCLQLTSGKTAMRKDVGAYCEQKECITCLANRNTTGCESSTFDLDGSQLAQDWETMTQGTMYKNWTIRRNIDAVCDLLMEMNKDDMKALSKMGAVRISKEQLLRFVRSKSPTQNVWPML
eukprot:13192956-Heterocapsa_arctica.AAC.1